jgi:hypothetical protein
MLCPKRLTRVEKQRKTRDARDRPQKCHYLPTYGTTRKVLTPNLVFVISEKKILKQAAGRECGED